MRPDTARSSKAETPRGRERERAGEKPQREPKADSLHPTSNGLAPSTADRERENTASPRSTIQVNGTRPRSNSGRSTPRKMDSRSAIPDLLSPLHPSLLTEVEGLETGRKRPAQNPAKTQRLDTSAASKKPRVPLKIPALLSPTLPPIVEAELSRLNYKKTPTKGEGSQQSSLPPESPSSGRKANALLESLDDQPSRSTKIVTLKLKKANAKRAKELLSLPSKSAKDAQRKERSMSVEATPPSAKKRPRLLEDGPSESSAAKRVKASAEPAAAKTLGPSTPLKQSATAMSRVTSSQSQGTPGNTAAGHTPVALERPPTRSDRDYSAEPGKVAMLRARSAEYQSLGIKLKHTRDAIPLDRKKVPGLDTSNERRAAVLSFEMLLAYMASFYSLDRARAMERKVSDPGTWESLMAHFVQIKSQVRANKALKALALQLQAVTLEQISAAMSWAEPRQEMPPIAYIQRWQKAERMRGLTWNEVAAASEVVEDRKFKMFIGPWTRVDEVVNQALTILRRWAEREDVQWKASLFKNAGEKERANGARDGS